MGVVKGGELSYETHAEPIKLGILMDWVVPDDHPQERVDDWFLPLELVFGEGLKQGVIDRPVELVVRRCWGLPKGSVKAVVDAYAELVEDGCLAVFGPSISDNCIPMREAIEGRFHVPAISCSGSDEWLGEWTFALPQGSMTDEPILLGSDPRQARAHASRGPDRAVLGRRVLHSQLPQGVS